MDLRHPLRSYAGRHLRLAAGMPSKDFHQSRPAVGVRREAHWSEAVQRASFIGLPPAIVCCLQGIPQAFVRLPRDPARRAVTTTGWRKRGGTARRSRVVPALIAAPQSTNWRDPFVFSVKLRDTCSDIMRCIKAPLLVCLELPSSPCDSHIGRFVQFNIVRGLLVTAANWRAKVVRR